MAWQSFTITGALTFSKKEPFVPELFNLILILYTDHNSFSISRHIALFSTTHCLNRIELTILIEIAAFSKCRICLHPHVSQMEHFSNGAILKSNISQMEHFSNEAILKSNISQMEHFSNEAILKSNISQMEQFSNRTFLKWSNLGSPPPTR